MYSIIRENEHDISHLKNKIQAKDKQKAAEIHQLRSSEAEQLRLQLKDLTSQIQLLKLEKQAQLVELNSNAALYENSTQGLLQEKEKLAYSF